MAIAQVQTPSIKDTASSNSDTLAYGVNVTAGSLLIVAARKGGADETFTVSDNVNGAWTIAVVQFQASQGKQLIAFFRNAAAGATTVTVSYTTATTLRWSIHEYSGVATSSPLDQTNSKSDATNQSASSGYAITTTVANELIFSTIGLNAGQTVTGEVSYTLRSQVPAAPSSRMASEELIVAATGTYTGTFTWTGTTTSYVACIASFKAAGAATATVMPVMFFDNP